ncbi:MAG: serine/threonine protein kinase [Gemmataceae bacterium]
MVTNDLGACEWFVWDLRRSGLIDRGQLDTIVNEYLKRNPRAEAPQLAEYLVQQGSLSAFQADRILNGKTQGLVLGPYVLADAIGQGSMGQVYRATSKNDSNPYAIKVLPRRSMWNVRLARRQVRSFGQFSHPAVVPFVDVGTAGGLHYLVWPLAEGQSLEFLINQNGRLSEQQTAMIGVQVAQGLNVAHQNNLFHGLVKPSNIMVGSDNQARILDFGIGSLLVENEGESLVDTMSTANTLTSGLDCASPESILEPTNRTPAGDQYSLGCVMYYCLTGRPPFPEGSAVEKMMAHQTKEPMPVREIAPEVAEGLCEVIRKLMAKKPEDRYSGCDEVVEALEPYLGELAETTAGATAAAVAASQSGGMNRPSGAAGYSNTAGSGPRMNPLPGSAPRMPGLNAKANVPAMPTMPSAARSSQMGGFGGGGLPSSPLPSRQAPSQARTSSSVGFNPPTPPAPVPSPRGTFAGGGGGFMLPGTPAPVSGRGQAPQQPAGFPNRGSLQMTDEVPLTPANIPEPPPFADPTRMSIPGGWVPGAADEPRRPAFGVVGIIAATGILMVLVFLGAKMLTQN